MLNTFIGDMEEYILYTGKINGIYREVRIYPVSSTIPNQYSIHWDGFEFGMINKIDNEWFTNSFPLVNVLEELGRHLDKKHFKEGRTLTIDGKKLTVISPSKKGRYGIEWDGLKIGYVRACTDPNNISITIWSGSTSLLNLHAQAIGQHIFEKNL